MVNKVYFDNVNSPKHYLKGKKETIDVIRDCMTTDEYHGYLKGNVLKYVSRYKFKGEPLQDLHSTFLEYVIVFSEDKYESKTPTSILTILSGVDFFLCWKNGFPPKKSSKGLNPPPPILANGLFF